MDNLLKYLAAFPPPARWGMVFGGVLMMPLGYLLLRTISYGVYRGFYVPGMGLIFWALMCWLADSILKRRARAKPGRAKEVL